MTVSYDVLETADLIPFRYELMQTKAFDHQRPFGEAYRQLVSSLFLSIRILALSFSRAFLYAIEHFELSRNILDLPSKLSEHISARMLEVPLETLLSAPWHSCGSGRSSWPGRSGQSGRLGR